MNKVDTHQKPYIRPTEPADPCLLSKHCFRCLDALRPRMCKRTYTICADPYSALRFVSSVVSGFSLCSNDEDGMFVDCVSVVVPLSLPKAPVKPFCLVERRNDRNTANRGVEGKVAREDK